MANRWKPIKYKEPKIEPQPHVINLHDKQLIQLLSPIIKSRQLIRFWYEDTDKGDFEDFRLVEPHLIGQYKYKSANIVLSAWFLPTPDQIINGHMEKWGSYILDGISKIEILDRKFSYPRIGYNNRDSRMTTIFCAT